jgi:hypothetical protein
VLPRRCLRVRDLGTLAAHHDAVVMGIDLAKCPTDGKTFLQIF